MTTEIAVTGLTPYCIINQILIQIFLIFNLGIEFIQMYESKFDYFTDFWNINYLLIYFFTILVMIEDLLGDSSLMGIQRPVTISILSL